MKHLKTFETSNTFEHNIKTISDAIENSDFDTIKKYADSGFDFNTYSKIIDKILNKNTILISNITGDDINIIKLIIDSGFDVNNISIGSINYMLSNIKTELESYIFNMLIDAGLNLESTYYPFYIIYNSIKRTNDKNIIKISVSILENIIKAGYDLSTEVDNKNIIQIIKSELTKNKSKIVLDFLYSKFPNFDDDIDLAYQSKKYNL